jgi:mannose-6-phosphate isomerase-like protein (cupin superfamily)
MEVHVKKGLLLIPLLIVGYLAGGAVLHSLIFREGPIPEEMYPRPGAVFESKWEGLEDHILQEQGDHYLKRVRVRPRAAGAPEHIHLSFEEDFHLLEGTLTFVVNGEERIVVAGQSARVPLHTPHRFFNPHDAPAVYEIRVPKHQTFFLSQFYGFTNEYGPPPEHRLCTLLQMSRFQPDA